MLYLVIVTLIWSFSFSFIGVYLSGQVDSWFAVAIRIVLACLLFLPFLRFKSVSLKQCILFMLVGASQLSIMYIFYYHSFNYISVPEILLFTIMTPVYVTLIYDLLQRHPLRWAYLFTAVLAVIGTAIIRYNQISTNFIVGFLLIQGANIFFALGQVGYKRIMELYPMPQHQAFSWVYLGAAVVAVICWLLFGDMNRFPTTTTQWIVLLWLGIVASGVCYFLWNYGATKVDSGTLAIMNNAVVPLGILVNVVVWQQQIEWGRFIIGSIVIIAALVLHRYWIVKTDSL
ncbi:carboxylate/amino acid/amine transporter [Zophobihabitans entericus]|uniref:DMT family transporter n=1 Tax=Zophobihabitans entericus TaxID=1635327 RepID=A0A6G9IDY7_9GAMM|nr:carboxylate/amino acid/amine transporter [Zophobihabitans entericus]QIQ21800.1 DMT family transporter [Zophobihabitans entericus]